MNELKSMCYRRSDPGTPKLAVLLVDDQGRPVQTVRAVIADHLDQRRLGIDIRRSNSIRRSGVSRGGTGRAGERTHTSKHQMGPDLQRHSCTLARPTAGLPNQGGARRSIDLAGRQEIINWRPRLPRGGRGFDTSGALPHRSVPGGTGSRRRFAIGGPRNSRRSRNWWWPARRTRPSAPHSRNVRSRDIRRH